MSLDAKAHYVAGIVEPRRVLRAVAEAVANAQHELNAHQFALVLDAPKMAADAPLELVTAARKYRIAELVLEYTEERSTEGFHRPHAVLFRVTNPAGQAHFVAELVIDGRTKEALVI